jgi:hypothetical protein
MAAGIMPHPPAIGDELHYDEAASDDELHHGRIWA